MGSDANATATPVAARPSTRPDDALGELSGDYTCGICGHHGPKLVRCDECGRCALQTSLLFHAEMMLCGPPETRHYVTADMLRLAAAALDKALP